MLLDFNLLLYFLIVLHGNYTYVPVFMVSKR